MESLRRLLGLRRHRLQKADEPKLPSLPAEIVLHVFAIALETHPPIATTLARLCKTMHNRLHDLLYMHAALRKHKQIDLLHRTLSKKRETARLVNIVEIIGASGVDASGGSPYLADRLSTLLPLTPNAVEVRLERVALLTVAFLHAAQSKARHDVYTRAILTILAYADIRTLTLDSIVLANRTSTWRSNPFWVTLPSLTSLTLSNVRLDVAFADAFLSPTFLPRVTSLRLIGSSRVVDVYDNERDLGELFPPPALVKQVQQLVIAPSCTDNAHTDDRTAPKDLPRSGRYDWLASASSVRSLSLPATAVDNKLLALLPFAHLERLELLPTPSASRSPLNGPSQSDLAALLALADALADLERRKTSHCSVPLSPRAAPSAATSKHREILPPAAPAPLNALCTLQLPSSWFEPPSQSSAPDLSPCGQLLTLREQRRFDRALAELRDSCDARAVAVDWAQQLTPKVVKR
ncbi:uncharacterized protein JCM10292_002444 [Rhodotorula paludigena]|uniref:uncharacterized protein n=1 Tax=Rhodotorula paludigena TaxID=86838 RepID=UPI00316D9B4E